MSKKTKPSPPAKKNKSDSFKIIAGSDHGEFNLTVIGQAVSSLWLAHADEEERSRQVNSVMLALGGIGPRDEMEGMLAAQMVACHNAAMECFRRAMIEEQSFEGRRENLNQAGRLTRCYAKLMEALNRNRGKGQQKVTVRHVHVNEGGQAIVGNVNTTGGGVKGKTEEQPHAKQK